MHFEERGGTNQSDRKNTALEPGFVEIDDRSSAELVRFVVEFSDLLVYYNANNQPDGTFRSVFEGDDTIDMILLASFDVDQYDGHFNDLLKDVKVKGEYVAMVKFFINLLFKINQWGNSFTHSGDLKTELGKYIHYEVVKVFASLKEFKEIDANSLASQLELFPKHWHTAVPLYIERTGAESFFSRLYRAIKQNFYELTSIGKKYLDKQLNNYQKINPQVALLLTYIDLYQEAKKEINQQTSRILNHFFQDVLGFERKKIIPDMVFLFPEISQNRSKVLIPEGSWFPAGKDSKGADIKYLTTKEFVISRVKAERFLSVCRDNVKPLLRKHPLIDFYHLPAKALNSVHEVESHVTPPGWVVGHSALLLEEGMRKISFKFTLDRFSMHLLKHRLNQWEKAFGRSIDMLGNATDVAYSTSQGWHSLLTEKRETFIETDVDGVDRLVFKVLIEDTDPPVGLFENCSEAASFYPLVPYFMFRPNKFNVSYSNFFFDLLFNNLTLNIDVLGVNTLMLQNDFGILDASSPFMPYGPTPHVGSSFYIGHKTIFTNPLQELYINIDWFGVPDLDNGFAEHYQSYSHINSNSVFKAKLLTLEDKQWIPNEESQIVELFENVEIEESPWLHPVNNFRGIDHIETDKISLKKSDRSGFSPMVSKAKSGWMKLELCYPPNAFGHKEFTDLVKKNIAESTKSKKVVLPPNDPWTPQAKSISIDYSSMVEVNFDEANQENSGHFYHLMPFGQKKINAKGTLKQKPLMPPMDIGSELYIGLSNLESPQIFSIFFRLSDYISDFLPPDQKFTWLIMNGGKWEILEQNQILEDETNGFIQSGTITFDISRKIDLTQSGELPMGYAWMKLVVNTNIYFFSNILDIRCEAIKAKYSSDDNPDSICRIEPNTISVAGNYIAGLAGIEQPYPSFGGRNAETHEHFIKRVSERLRHKNRMINVWDYEHLILEEFPEVNRVKCLPNTNHKLKSEPGNVLIVIVPFVERFERSSHIPSLPRNYLEKVKRFVKMKTSPFAKVEIMNPIYEEVKLKFNVRFKRGINYRHYTEVLQNELIAYFSPWLFKSNSQLNFGINIRGASIIYFLEKLPYVDVITNLGILQIVGGRIIPHDLSASSNVIIKPTSAISIFISSEKHLFNVALSDMDELEGIEDMMLGNDFILEGTSSEHEKVEDGIESLTLGLDFALQDEKSENPENEECYILLKESKNG